MTDSEALRKVLEHAKLDVHAVSTDEDREAIKIVEQILEQMPKQSGSNYTPIGGAGNGA